MMIDDFSRECLEAKANLKRKFALSRIMGKSKAINKLRDKIIQVSSCDVNVLISGKSGTGKELVARAIHYLSCRAGKPFIPVNCGAIPENLFENELFGHTRGAFTDAKYSQKGIVQEADRGTLFLDEIGATGMHAQVKLLRLLQENEFKPLGNSKIEKADIRIIAATNEELTELVEKGTFREDLYYRLNIVSLHVPALLKRKEDIPLLAEHFLDKYSKEHDKPHRQLTKEAVAKLVLYSWPGNIRELENKIQQLVVMSGTSTIDAKDIKLFERKITSFSGESEYFKEAKRKAVESFEKGYLVNLMTDHHGNVVSAARESGKSRTALWNLLKKHNIFPRQYHI